MNILPSLEEVKQIAATGEYNVLPVSCCPTGAPPLRPYGC